MKKQGIIVVAIMTGLGLFGCQSSSKANTPTITHAAMQTDAHGHLKSKPAASMSALTLGEALMAYDWQLLSVTNKAQQPILPELFNPNNQPLIASFDKDNVRFKNTCNHLWGGYRLSGNRLELEDMASTMKICEPALMDVDILAPSTLQGSVQLVQTAQLPVLVISSANQISHFQAVAKSK